MKYHILYNKKWNIVNSNDLYLTRFKDDDNNIIQVYDYINRSIYVFRIYELLSIYKNALYHNGLDDDEDGTQILPSPCYPKNPYTNLKFTLQQHINIYISLLSIYCKNKRTLPKIVALQSHTDDAC